jgi:ubiquinone/menaquinone biosynthesis C-methylase UbiE
MTYRTADAKKQFDRWSYCYDFDPLQFLFFRPAHQMLLQAVEPADRRILDIGCGTCAFAARVLDRFPKSHVCGIDLSEGMLQRCRKRRLAAEGRLHLVQADSERLPFKDDVFDAVTCAHSFHHYPHQERAIAEMHRVLRPGGKLLIIDGDRDRTWGHLLFEVLVVSIEGPVRHRTSREFRDLYQEAGFASIIQHRRGGPFPFLLTCGRAVKPAKTTPTFRAA